MDRKNLIKRVLAKVKDKVPGGEGDGRPDSDFDPKQLSKGISVEVEHTHDLDLAKEIAKDHLSEVGNYYLTEEGEDRLKLMEQEAEKELENK